MDNYIELSFTVGQLFLFVGIVCVIVLTIYLVSLLRNVAKAAKEATALIQKAHETLDDVRDATEETIERITDSFGKLKTAVNIADKFRKIKKNKEK